MGGTRTWLTDAAAYVRAGYDVFPCVAGAKRPIPADGFHAATRDARTLTHWAMRHPDANLAVPTGRGMSAVDLDNDAAAQWFEGAMADAGLDFGPIAFTPRGGLRVWFRDPGRVRCRVGRVSDADLRPGFDVRGVGGYVVVAPSRTPEGVYVWASVDDLPPPVSTLPPWPDAVVPADPRVRIGRPGAVSPAEAKGRTWKRRCVPNWKRWGPRRPARGNDTLNRAAFSLARFPQLDRATLEDVLVRAGMRAGLSEHEARRTVRSGLPEAGVMATTDDDVRRLVAGDDADPTPADVLRGARPGRHACRGRRSASRTLPGEAVASVGRLRHLRGQPEGRKDVAGG